MKTALITGASRGIGRGIAEALMAEGYQLVVNCKRNGEMLSELGAIASVGDVSDPAYCRELVAFAREKLGHIDVLFHNAGTCKVGLIQDFPDAKWNRIMDVNVNSAFYMSREIIPVMLQQGHGKIVFTSSAWGESGAAFAAAYAASKGAVNAFTKSIARELAASNIQVNAIAPGPIETDMNKGYTPEEHQAVADETAIGRFGTPEEIGAVAKLLAEAPAYLTGQIITVDGCWKV